MPERSIDTEKLLRKLKADEETAKKYFEEKVQPYIIERRDIYDADKDFYSQKFPRLSVSSDFVSLDAYSTVEWILAPLLKAYLGGDQIIDYVGESEQYVDAAEANEKVANYQIMRQNEGFFVFHDWIKAAIIDNVAWAKLYWRRTFKTEESTLVLQQTSVDVLTQDEGIEILSQKPVTEEMPDDLQEVKIRRTYMDDDFPQTEFIPVYEMRWIPRGRKVKDFPYVSQTVMMTVDELNRRSTDDWENLDEIIENPPDAENNELADRDEEYDKDQHDEVEEALKEIPVKESYTFFDIEGDGFLTPIVVFWAGDYILHWEENTAGRHPFFMLTPSRDPGKNLASRGLLDVIADLQHCKTAIFRQIIRNIALNNAPKIGVLQNRVNWDDILSGSEYIRCQESPRDSLFPIPTIPLAPWTFNFVEKLESEKENWTGWTRYSGGQNGASLNDTATGISVIMEASGQRVELISRIMAEGGIKEYFQHLIGLNQRFLSQEVAFNIVGDEFVAFQPQDLLGKVNVEIHAGVGAGLRQQQLAAIRELMNGMFPIMVQMGIAGPPQLYNLVKLYVELMGMKNMKDIAIKPQMDPMMMAMMAAQGGMPNGNGAPNASGSPDQAGGNSGGVQGLPPVQSPGGPGQTFSPARKPGRGNGGG